MAQLEKMKLSTLPWDSDKDPTGFNVWIETIGSLVRATAHGPPLENMLDHKLNRTRGTSMSIPSWLLNDPDFAAPSDHDRADSDPDEDEVLSGETNESMIGSSRSAASGATFSLGSCPFKYSDLSDESRNLDAQLYNILKMNVKGTKNALLSCVSFPSYVQAVCVLSKHVDISRLDRMVRIIDRWESTRYQGNVQDFQVQVMANLRELNNCNLTLQHYCMIKLMKAFDGKSKAIQFKIADDFNNKVIDESLNVFDLVQKYCADLASVGDGLSKKVNYGGVICYHCNKPGHTKPNCPDRDKPAHPDAKHSKPKDGKGNRNTRPKVCNHCKKSGHSKDSCPHYLNMKDKEKKKTAGAPSEGTVMQAVNNSQAENQTGLTQLAIEQCLKQIQQIQSGNCNMVKTTGKTDPVTVLSLCDGMGGGALALQNVGASIDRYVAVEVDSTKRIISDNANPSSSSFPGIDHSWKSDINDIREQDIVELGPISLLLMAPVCDDHSPLRLLGIPRGKPDPRPGFKGKKGATCLKCIEILCWVLKHNPGCEYFVEHIKFDDMAEDWAFVCKYLGDPYIIDSADHSYTRRVRSYWSNFVFPVDPSHLTAGYPPLDPNSVMDPGRTVEPYHVDGKVTVRTIGKSWRGDPHNPEANTTVPVIVHDEQFQKAQQLRPSEAERLMGLPLNCTSGCGVTAKDRLRAIGDGWDLNVTSMLFRFCQLAVGTPLSAHPAARLTDSGAGSTAVPDGTAPLLPTLLDYRSQAGDQGLAALIALFPMEQQLQMLELIKSHHDSAKCMFSGSVLDSGSSRHLSPNTHVLDNESLVSLTGFDQSQSWTSGNGYLPIRAHDEHSDSSVQLDIQDADKMDGVAQPILSLGKLLRQGWDFHFSDNGRECYALSPGGDLKFLVDLGSDDILRFPHGMRTGGDRAPLPSLANNAVLLASKTLKRANGQVLHDIFNHCGMERVYQTLRVTTGYEATRFPDFHCSTCAMSKSRRRGLSHKVLLTQTLSILAATESDYADDDLNDDDRAPDLDLEIEYVAPVAGRSLGIQSVPRVNLEQLRPFELMFCDNKDYDVVVRGGRQIAFIMCDYKTTAKFKIDLTTKKDNGNAFRRIVTMLGVHKLPYNCRIMSDGCGSMEHVALAAALLGIDHAYIPPHEQSLNEAEKVCNFMWAAARALLLHSKAPLTLLSEAVSYAMYVDLRTATTASRQWLTPYEQIKGMPPTILKLHRFYTRCYVSVPKSKRKKLVKKGLLDRSESGRFIGFHDPFSTTFRVLLEGNRLVHSINVTFDDEDFVHGQSSMQQPDSGPRRIVIGASPSVLSEEARNNDTDAGVIPDPNLKPVSPGAVDQIENQQQIVSIEHCDLFEQLGEQIELPEYFNPDDDSWKTFDASSPQARPRPNYKHQVSSALEHRSAFLVQIEESERLETSQFEEALAESVSQYMSRGDSGGLIQACRYLAMLVSKDMNWSAVLKSDDRDKAIAALQAEKDSLLSTILIKIDSDHPEYADAMEQAITGRFLLDEKRSGVWKARGVKQGFKEDKSIADGPDFVYYAHVAKLVTIRATIFRPNRGNRRLGIKDVKTAFLQSDKYPTDLIKYVVFKDPLTLEYEFFRQLGPLYGECSAPVRWEDTAAAEMDAEGYTRGLNEQSTFYHEERDITALLYVDDFLYDADETEVKWASDQLADRFDCKELEWVEPDGGGVDYIGMELSQTDCFVRLSMNKYIQRVIDSLGFDRLRNVQTPIVAEINSESGTLTPPEIKQFMTGLGCLGWLSNTARPDITYTHSRIAQHMSNPSRDAYLAVQRAFSYLKSTAHYGLRCCTSIMESDLSQTAVNQTHEFDNGSYYEFYVDTDHAGNAEKQNKRRSQIGYIALVKTGDTRSPILWASKVSSIAFAHPDIGEAHADISSGAAEVYGTANATFDFLHLGYVIEELGLEFPKPFTLLIDNAAAEAFARNSAQRSKLKHIDCRQEWVQMLRDKNIVSPQHVSSELNIADLFTKILPADRFISLRDMIMYKID